MKYLDKKIQLLFSLIKTKKISEAKALNKILISEYPKNEFLYNTLGIILTEEKDFKEAILCYKRGLSINPNFAPIYNNLGNVHRFNKNYKQAENCFKKSIILENKNPEPRNNLGNFYSDMNRNEDAIKSYIDAISVNSDFVPAHFNLGLIYKKIGDSKKSIKHLNISIKLKPLFLKAHRALSDIINYKKNNDHFKVLKKIYEETKIKKLPNVDLLFALGKAHEDTKDFDKAFSFYQEGNKSHRKNINFSIENEKKEISDIKNAFNKKFFSNYTESINLDNTPIFIVGMPRSGTTLVEQILSSHPNVYGGDELNYIPDLVKKYLKNDLNLLNTDSEILRQISNEYIDRLKKLSSDSKKITDKLPMNFKWIGLIKIILPNSKIVHCTRDSRDICLSIFKNFFTSNKMNFAYDIEEICEYYNLYSNMMKYWQTLLPNFIYDINYEKLVKKPKDQIKYLLKECNLDWNDNCLKFYENKRAVQTRSDIQVRQKIYKTSINSWENYRKDLEGPFSKLMI